MIVVDIYCCWCYPVLLRLWVGILSVIPVTALLALFGEITGLYKWETHGNLLIGIGVGGFLSALFSEVQNPY